MNEGKNVFYGFNSESLAFDPISLCFPDLDFPDDGKIDMNIQPKLNYIGYNFYPNNCIELISLENGQVIFINLDTKKYQIYQVRNTQNKSEFYSFDFKKQNEAELYRFAKGEYQGFYHTNCCSIN